jgi:hypothetical protein
MLRSIFISLLVLAGPAIAEDIPDDHGVVLVYRPRQFTNSMIKPGIKVDKREYPALPGGKFLVFVLSEGEHEFDLILSDNYDGSAARKISVVAGAKTYVRLDTAFEQNGNRITQRLFKLTPVTMDEAVPQIVKCRKIDLEKGKRYRNGLISDD